MSKVQVLKAQDLVVQAADEMRTLTALWMSPLLAPESRPHVLIMLRDAQTEYNLCSADLKSVARKTRTTRH